MKKVLGYLIVIILGVVSIVSLINRSENLDNNVSKGTNTVELFAKN